MSAIFSSLNRSDNSDDGVLSSSHSGERTAGVSLNRKTINTTESGVGVTDNAHAIIPLFNHGHKCVVLVRFQNLNVHLSEFGLVKSWYFLCIFLDVILPVA